MKDHYRTLGVPDNASETDIKLAYRRLAKRYHPDVNAGAKGAEERFKEITEAYSVLSDFSLRRAYDTRRMGPVFYSPAPQPEKKDPRRKEYSEEDLERARVRYKKRNAAHIARRKKMLVGMIISFILFVTASAIFDNWIQENREEDSIALEARLDSIAQQKQQYQKTHIENMDSPFDSLFGPGVYQPDSKNKLIIQVPFTDAVVCAVQAGAPHKTIRNEYIEANNGFVMNQMPDGAYSIKFCTGKAWDVNKRIPGGKKLGGFTRDELFLEVKGPYRAGKKIKNKMVATQDTVWLNPYLVKFDTITAEEFYNPGE